MTHNELILRRTIELLVAAGHVPQEKVDEARKIAEDCLQEEMQAIAEDNQAETW